MKSCRTNHVVRAFQRMLPRKDNAMIVKKTSNSDSSASITQFYNAHVVQVSISNYKSYKGSFLMEAVYATCSRVEVESTPTIVSFDEQQVAMTANKYVWFCLHQFRPNSFGITPGSAAYVSHEKGNPLELPGQLLIKFCSHYMIVDIAVNNAGTIWIQSLNGVCDSERSDVSGVPNFIAVLQMVVHSFVPMAMVV